MKGLAYRARHKAAADVLNFILKRRMEEKGGLCNDFSV
jgi:hypothetical protein